MKRGRTILLSIAALVLLIPPLTVGLWMLSLRPGEPPPPPRWVIARREQRTASCQAALLQVSDPPAEPAAGPSSAQIDQSRARRIADQALRAHLGFGSRDAPDNVSGPTLLSVTLPDGQLRLVWARLWALDNVIYERNSVVVHLDAATGEPLVIYTDITVIDPVFAPGCIDYAWEAPQVYTPGVVLRMVLQFEAILLAAMALIAGVIWGLRRLRAARSREQKVSDRGV